MKTFTRIIFLLLFVLTTHFSFAQLNYQVGGFSNASSTYSDLGTSGTSITMSNNDTGHSATIPIGFTFNFNGAAYDSFVMYVDGFVKLGSLPVSSAAAMLFTAFNQPPYGGPFNNSTSTGYNPTAGPQDTSLLVAFGHDLWSCNVGRATSQLGAGTADFRVSTTGTTGSRVCTIQWKNISDKTVFISVQNGTPAADSTQYDTINFQIKLYESTNVIEYVYGRWVASQANSSSHFAACGIKGNNNTGVAEELTLTKASGAAWSISAPNNQSLGFPLGNYNTTTSNAVNYGNNVVTSRPAPDIGRTYRFGPVVYNDMGIATVYAMGKIALSCYVPDSIRAYITNPGVNAQTSVVVTLLITGANTYYATATIASIASGQSTYVAFPPYTPTNTGQNLITVSVPTDDNNSNNVFTYGFSVSNRFIAYTDTLKPAGQGQGTTSPNFWGCRYTINGTRIVTQVKAFLLSSSNAAGDTVAGFVLDTLGNILGRSANYIVINSDLGTWLTFDIISPPVVTNGTFIAGICGGAIVNGSVAPFNYYLGSYQLESPIRPQNRITQYSYYNIINSTLNMTSSAPGLFFGTPGVFSNGRLMMECTVDQDTADIGISASIPANNGIVPTGSPISLRAYVKNFGSNVRASGLSVKYSLDGGAAVGPLNTTVGLNQNDTTSVYFTGTNAFTISTAGTHTVKIYTSYANDQIRGNDTLVLTLNALAPITTFPYRIATGILTIWTPINNSSTVWVQGTATQPNGVSATTVLYANNTGVINGSDAKMLSPIFSFAGVTNPTLYFYVAHAPNTTTSTDDTLQVLVSTNGGATFTPVYTRSSQLSSPTLGTVAASSTTTYTPAAASDWRHETVNLSAYSGNTNVIIAFRDKSASGKSVWVSDIIISNPTTLSTQAVAATNTFVSGIISVGMNSAIGSSNGQLSISRYNSAPYSSASPVYATNSSATTNSGGIFTPNNVSQDNWWTITYSGIGTGNLPSTVPYYVLINTSTVAGISRPDSLYIMRRSENNGSWIALPTTRSTSTLLTGPLTGFSDFAIGSTTSYNPLPVAWLNVSAKKLANFVLIDWTTASEINNNHFVVERSINGNDFMSIGNVASSGNSNNEKNYSFTDNNLVIGVKTIYYHIRQVDNDGASTTSQIVSVNIDEVVSPIVAYPNPFSKDLQLSFNSKSQDIKIVVMDLSGREVYNKALRTDVNSTSIKLTDLNKLESGFYMMNVLIDGESHILKINKTE